MRVKAIRGFYAAEYSRIIEKDEMADFDDARADELINLGLAENAGPVKKPAKKSARKE